MPNLGVTPEQAAEVAAHLNARRTINGTWRCRVWVQLRDAAEIVAFLYTLGDRASRNALDLDP